LRTNPTVISFYPEKIQAIVVLYINDATLWVFGATTNLIFTPASSQTTYANGISIPLVAVAASGTQTTTLTASTVGQTSLTYNVVCSQYGKFVYHLARSFSYNASACALNQTQMGYWLSQSSLDSLRVSESYYQCSDAIGALNVAAGVSQTLTLSNLYSSTAYQLDGYC
jgi:invasion protein IalB